MTANINTKLPAEAKLVRSALTTVDHLSYRSTKDDQITALSVANANAEKNRPIIDVSATSPTHKILDKKQDTALTSNSAQQDPESEKDLNQAVKQLNSYVQSVNRQLEFTVDTESGRTVVKVTDAKTGEVIRQIPTEETLRVVRQLDKKINGGAAETDGFLLGKLQA